MEDFVNGSIYAIEEHSTGRVVYVGSTVDFDRRKQQHLNPYKKYPIHRYIEENGGWSYFSMFILENVPLELTDESELKLLKKERIWIERFGIENLKNTRLPYKSDYEKSLLNQPCPHRPNSLQRICYICNHKTFPIERD